MAQSTTTASGLREPGGPSPATQPALLGTLPRPTWLAVRGQKAPANPPSVNAESRLPTLQPCLTAWTTISTTVVVFPVPGGPWTMASSFWDSANETASFCEASREALLRTGGAAGDAGASGRPRPRPPLAQMAPSDTHEEGGRWTSPEPSSQHKINPLCFQKVCPEQESAGDRPQAKANSKGRSPGHGHAVPSRTVSGRLLPQQPAEPGAPPGCAVTDDVGQLPPQEGGPF